MGSFKHILLRDGFVDFLQSETVANTQIVNFWVRFTWRILQEAAIFTHELSFKAYVRDFHCRKTPPDLGGARAWAQDPPSKRGPHHVYVFSHMYGMCVPLKVASHRIRLQLTNRLTANGSLHTCSKNTITDNHGNSAYLHQF